MLRERDTPGDISPRVSLGCGDETQRTFFIIFKFEEISWVEVLVLPSTSFACFLLFNIRSQKLEGGFSKRDRRANS
ncbi:hypothetical protein BDZ94DRAFT_418103 [Collybia nuda]|uniref:Uncharacterized protein n=1 Tax=Collybia nuda TaxID=64659 RepID=A0A9P6CCS3_9AGAR|nr:hypothetical protein BDZ94DRAFT_418103 [Collybia nuda]